MAMAPVHVLFSIALLQQLSRRCFGQEAVLLPVCTSGEFLTANETTLFCSPLPETSFCDCPDLVPTFSNGTVVTPTFPLPPPGCPDLKPPARGAFVCLRQPTIIFCSVLCDHRFEFFTAPHNPYSCGESTGFRWRDKAGAIVTGNLPVCTGFRHRVQSLYPTKFYLPFPCHGLPDDSSGHILRHFHSSLLKNCPDCELEDTFLRCPSIPPSSRRFTDIKH